MLVMMLMASTVAMMVMISATVMVVVVIMALAMTVRPLEAFLALLLFGEVLVHLLMVTAILF